jgi:hypothetical protein
MKVMPACDNTWTHEETQSGIGKSLPAEGIGYRGNNVVSNDFSLVTTRRANLCRW